MFITANKKKTLFNPVMFEYKNKQTSGLKLHRYQIYTKYSYGPFINFTLTVGLSHFILQLPIQSVPITTHVVSSNPTHGEVYLIQYYVIKFVSGLRQVNGFLRVLRFPPLKKLTATNK